MAAYGDFEYGIILGHKHELDNGEILKGNPDLNPSKARNKYNKFITDVTAVNAREFTTNHFQRLDRKEVIDTALAIIVFLFGEEAVPEAVNFFKNLMPAEERNLAILEGVTLTVLDTETKETKELTQVPDMTRSGTIVTIVHEFAHYYCKKKGVDHNKKRYYFEVISILAEKIAAFMTENHLREYALIQKMEESRLESISHHYNIQLKLVEDRIKEHEQIKKLAASGQPQLQMVLAQMEHQIPLLDTPQNISILRDFYQAQADSFGIGYLYAENLFQKFLEDNKALALKLKSLFGNEISLQDLLNYYGLDLRDYHVYNNVNTRLEEVKRGKSLVK